MSVIRYNSLAMREWLMRGIEPDWLKRHTRRRYIIQSMLSKPPWVDTAHLRRIHAWARFLTITTGILHVVDHIIPLCHPDVCGLTVPWNLRVITRAQNAAKSGKWNPWQLPLL